MRGLPRARAAPIGLALLLAVSGGCRPEGGVSEGGAATSHDPLEVARAALGIANPFDRFTRFSAVLGDARPEQLSDLREAVGASALGVGDPEIAALGMWWARFDPAAAAAWTGADWRAQSADVVRGVYRVWAHEDPQAAVAGLELTLPRLAAAARSAAVAGWQESGKPGLLETLRSADIATRQRLGEEIAWRWVQRLGAEGALRHVEAIDPPELGAMLARRVASAAAAQGEPEEVAAWAGRFVTSGDERPSGYPRRIATRWIRSDPPAALAWLRSLPAGKDRVDGVMESFRDWLRLEPEAAQAWLESAEPEPWLEPALSIRARRLARDSPREAMEIVAGFSDDGLRDRIAVTIMRQWVAAEGPDAFKAWLAEAELPDSTRGRLESAPLLDRQRPARPRRRPAGPAG